jgi:8-oxo-dGTP diphosphatase
LKKVSQSKIAQIPSKLALEQMRPCVLTDNVMTMEVVAAAIMRDGRLLACRRAPDKALAGFWEFPGGKVEADESPEAALIRELREELSVDITVLSHFHTNYGENGITLSVYVVESATHPVSSDSHDALRWLTKVELDEVTWAELDVPALEELRQNKNSNLWGQL